jgi:hypothetical protein
MTIKEYLAIGGLSSDLIGAFLLAVPALLGVRTALGWVLHVRGRLRRHLHFLNLSLSHRTRALKRKREIMFGWPDPSDLKKQAEGEQVNITPYYFVASSLFVILGVWYLLGEHIYWMLVTPHEAIVHVTGWLRYLLHVMIGLAQALIVIALIAALGIASYLFWFFSTPIIVAVFIAAFITFGGALRAAILVFSVPARVLRWVPGGSERKKWLGWASRSYW